MRPGHLFLLPACVRCSVWMRVEPASGEQAKAAEEQWRANEAKRKAEHEKAAAKGADGKSAAEFREQPFPGVEAGEGFVLGRTYEWSPWSNEWLTQVSSERVKAGAGWRQVSFEIDVPDWGPFLDIRFQTTLGSAAYLDEFSFRDTGAASGPAK